MTADQWTRPGGKDPDPPTPVELALACLMVALEERDPTLSDRWVSHAEDDALHAEVRRLHAKAPRPQLVANLHEAMEIAQRVRFLVKAHVKAEPKAEEPVRKARRKGRG